MGHEPKHLNEFLKTTVNELKALWKGVWLQSSLSAIPLVFRVALLCTSSDIPTSRKLCGFKGHSVQLGCSRCVKEFPGLFGEKRDYSGFDRDSWMKRKNKDHRQQAKRISKCKTQSDQKKTLKNNLNFGFLRVTSTPKLSKVALKVPVEIGRLPKQISSNYGSYTAEQWKNWRLIYSLHALKGVLNDQQLQCWQTFVLACKYLCKPVLSKTDILKADNCLLKFCTRFQELYGNEAVFQELYGNARAIWKYIFIAISKK
ncbi:Hypothetical predicted protein [Paramuricea clavata]|uniref:Uncharacterized protein n=1 Tax=Paramuricea clavata TaxID=317549 RepID=A0A6S7HC32_PARCT|nr:Hypothetical predicted protein [Paramuricea clavata]